MNPAPLRSRDFALAGLVAAACLALYAPVFGSAFEFVGYDDPEYVTANPVVRGGLSLEGWVWSLTDTEHANWHPLTWLSHMLDVELFGMSSPAHHGVNALLHALNSALVLLLLRLATGALWRSAVVAMLFAAHPLHVESVAWVSERKDVLSTAFGLLASIAYVAYGRRGGAVRYAAVTAAFGAALLSKAMFVTLPCVFLLLDHWPLRRAQSLGQSLGLLREKVPWLGMSLALCVVTLIRQEGAGAMDWSAELGLLPRLAASLHAYVGYGMAMAWPTGLAVHYAHPYLPEWGGTPPAPAVLVLEGLLLAIVSWGALRRVCPPVLRVGWLWYLGTLVPVIGWVQVGSQGMADRYTYFPSIGLFMAAVWGVGFALDALGRSRPGLSRALAGSASAAAIGGLALATALQLPTWQSSESLFEAALRVNPRNTAMWLALGDARRQDGDESGAREAYEAALEIHPLSSTAHANLGRLLLTARQPDAAIAHYRAALVQAARPAEAHSNLGGALLEAGRGDEAIAQLRLAIDADPEFAEAHYNLGNALFSAGRLADAARAYEGAIRARSEFAAAHLNLGRVRAASGDLPAALEHFRSALALDPDYRAARQSLDRALAMMAPAPR